MKKNVLYIDFGSTVTRFGYNQQKVALETTVPYNFVFKEEYLSVDKLFQNVKRDWVNCKLNKLAVIKYFQHIKDTYEINNVKKIKASYPTHFTHSKKHGYKSILAYVFNINIKDVELISESTALLRGSNLYQSNANIVAADVGGYTTDIFMYKDSLNVKGYEIGGELVTNEIAEALYNYKYSQVVDLVKAKELKEAHFEHGKLASLKVMESIILNNAADKLISFDELFKIVDNSFDKIYNRITNKIKEIAEDNDLIYIFGGVAEIDRFQKIIKKQLGMNVQFINDTFILIDGLIADEKEQTAEVLAEDLYIACTYMKKPYFLKLGQAGMPFPITTTFESSIVSNSKDFVTLNNPNLVIEAAQSLYTGSVSEVYTNVNLSDFVKEELIDVTVIINKDSVEIAVNNQTVVESIQMEAMEYQAKIEKQAKDIYDAELAKRQILISEKIQLLELMDIEKEDEVLFASIKQSLKGVLLNRNDLVSVPVPLINEEILQVDNMKDFFSYFENGSYQIQHFVINKFLQKDLTLLDKFLKLLKLYKEPHIFTGTKFEKLYFDTITKVYECDNLEMVKNELFDYYTTKIAKQMSEVPHSHIQTIPTAQNNNK